jgi:hypothetical protein
VALLFNPATTVPVKFYMSSIEAAASSFAINSGGGLFSAACQLRASPDKLLHSKKDYRASDTRKAKTWKSNFGGPKATMIDFRHWRRTW